MSDQKRSIVISALAYAAVINTLLELPLDGALSREVRNLAVTLGEVKRNANSRLRVTVEEVE